MISSSRTKAPTSLPIPIIQSSKARNTKRGGVVSSCTPPKSNSLTSVKSFDYYYKDNVSASSGQSTPTKQQHVFDLDDDYCVISCKDITSYLTSSRVHLVNGLNVDSSVTNCNQYFVLCDCPKIKTPSNYLSYSLLETKKGVLAFTQQDYAVVMKEQLALPYHIVQVTKEELIAYTNALKAQAIVLYNSYTDMDIKASYFLYFLLE